MPDSDRIAHEIDVHPVNRGYWRWECTCGEASESCADLCDEAWSEGESHARFCNDDPIFGDNGALARQAELESEVQRLTAALAVAEERIEHLELGLSGAFKTAERLATKWAADA